VIRVNADIRPATHAAATETMQDGGKVPMKIQVFDPALCCSSGVCGVDVDQNLVDFSSTAGWAESTGLKIERFNLAQQPMAFAENPVVKHFLERSGAEALPLTLVDGEIALAGRYPTRSELTRWTGTAAGSTAAPAAPACCGGKSC
jgi:hypothetical protein